MTDQHVVPRGDLVLHELDATCACGPTVDAVGPSGAVWVHHSLDGREAREPAP